MKAIASAAALLLAPACLGFGGDGYTPIRTAFNRGVYHYSRGDHEAAVSSYREALDEDALDHRARFNLAVALEALAARVASEPGGEAPARHLRAEAKREYSLVLTQRPGDLRASVNLAAMEFERGEVQAAFERLGAAVREHPESVLARAALASHFLREGLAAEAASLLAAAQVLDPTDAGVNSLLGEAAMAMGDRVRARDAFRRVLAVEPRNGAALLALARMAADAGDRFEAVDFFRRAALADPGCHEAHLRLSELYALEGGDLEEAVRHLWRARDLRAAAASEFQGVDYEGRLRDLYRRLTGAGRN